MPLQAFTQTERMVARCLANDPVNFCNGFDWDACDYMVAVASMVARGDLSDEALLSMAREVLQQYLRDTKAATVSAEQELEAAVRNAEASFRQMQRELPAQARIHRGVVA
ncbi:hypothetical protein E5S69_11740 [Cupriavidus necator]|uniref:hypothetical protein n=1 Tax=Cupriavidus necator TaxID=106590 RepID=UPI00148FE504|nr:hypothetical protein [Cupriavidus necator]NOV24184.1 hypothetical protein [Cupriavidus necator]